MNQPITFEITDQSQTTDARRGIVTTLHGSFETPAFMPVGTKASVKGLLPTQVRDTGTQILLNNTYHLMLRPGSELIRDAGGVHQFMRWDGPILTDSGGYQVFSMSDINRISEEGVLFKSIVDGSMINLTPERSMEVQNNLGPDIMMAFDDCPPALKDGQTASEYEKRLDVANERTIRWLDRCTNAHKRSSEQALFGIVQGGIDPDRRAHCVEQVCNFDLPGFAIGGVAVGEGTEEIARVVQHTAPLMPHEKPRYLMGVGYEWDILTAVLSGVDMFDCVLPTRNGRNANAFTRIGQIRLRNACYEHDLQPIEVGCKCVACSEGFSRSYIRHLFRSQEMLGPMLVSMHNIAHFQSFMVDIRCTIADDGWSALKERWPVLCRGSQNETSIS